MIHHVLWIRGLDPGQMCDSNPKWDEQQDASKIRWPNDSTGSQGSNHDLQSRQTHPGKKTQMAGPHPTGRPGQTHLPGGGGAAQNGATRQHSYGRPKPFIPQGTFNPGQRPCCLEGFCSQHSMNYNYNSKERI